MKRTKLFSTLFTLTALLLLALGLAQAGLTPSSLAQGPEGQPQANPAAPLGTSFTYQGQLIHGGEPISDTCDFDFALYDDLISGTLVAGPLDRPAVPLTEGRFTVDLDFGDVFDGTALWLEVAVQCPGDAESITLDPRQALSAAPYANHSRHVPWSGITSKPPGFDDDVDNDTLGELSAGPGQIAKWDGSVWIAAPDDVDDADADPANELNSTLALSGTELLLGDAGGTLAAELGGLVDDADADPTNELEMPVGCAGDQVARWDGGDWLCADDMVITYTAGFGLDLAGTTFNVLTATVQQRVDGACGAGYAIQQVNADGSVVCEADDDTTYTAGFGLNLSSNQFSVVTSTVQARLSESCTVGYSIRAINADGTVECEPHDPRPGFSTTTLDDAGHTGELPTLIIGSDGLGLIAYCSGSGARDLVIAHCDDIACTSGTRTVIDSTGSAFAPSLMIGSDGLGLISYHDSTTGDLRVAHCDNVACTSATFTTTVSSPDTIGLYSSIAIGADGLGLISYWNLTRGNLEVAHCNNVACTSAITTTLDSVNDVGMFTSIAIGADGLGLISYHDETSYDLKVAHCSNIACTSAVTTTIDNSTSVTFNSLTIGTDGLGLISYSDQGADLGVAHCDNTNCTAATITTLDSAGDVGNYSSVTIGADGLGLISYFDSHSNYDLKVAHCSNVACTSASSITVVSAGDPGVYSEITVGTDGMGLIVHFENNLKDLLVTHCSNLFCTPYVWQR